LRHGNHLGATQLKVVGEPHPVVASALWDQLKKMWYAYDKTALGLYLSSLYLTGDCRYIQLLIGGQQRR